MSTFLQRQKQQNSAQEGPGSSPSRRVLWGLLALAMALMFSPPDWTVDLLARLWVVPPASGRAPWAVKAAQERRRGPPAALAKAPAAPNSVEMVKTSVVRSLKAGVLVAGPGDFDDMDSFVSLDLGGAKAGEPLIYKRKGGRFDLARRRSLRQLQGLVALNPRGARVWGGLERGALWAGRHFDGIK